MKSSPTSPGLTALLNLLQDETADDLTKWRNLCFTQLTRLRFTEFHHFHVGLDYEATATRLTEQLQNTLSRLSDITAQEGELKKALTATVKCEQDITQRFARFNSANASEKLLQIQLDHASETFSAIYDGHRATGIRNLQRLFARVGKNVNALSTSIGRVETKVQTLAGILKKRRQEIERVGGRASRLRSEIDDLRTAFSQVALPVFPPEVTAISTQFQNSVEASKKCLALEKSIAEMEASMQKVRLDNRPSQCGALEDLIEKQKESHRTMAQTLLDRHNTDDIEKEIEQAVRDVAEVEETLKTTRESTESESARVNEAIQSQSLALKQKIADNASVIEELRHQKNELLDQVPRPSKARKVSREAQTVYKEPILF
jgi:SMC interacting uncharacterized protein involved in chromosome segregation